MKVKEEIEKTGLKLNIKKPKIVASGPITSWQIDGGTIETVTDFIFLGSRITADGDCSHEIKRHLLLGRKAKTKLESILKSRDITLLTKVYKVKALVFPVVMYGCESWTVKKAECQRTDTFELWCWRRLFRVLWTARSNQSILKEISPDYLLERLKAGGEGDDRGWDGWMASLTQWTWVWAKSGRQWSSVAQSCPTLYDPIDCSTPDFPAPSALIFGFDPGTITVTKICNDYQW